MDSSRLVSATEFKAKCLRLLDEIETKGASITVTRRGRPVAVIGPAPADCWKSPKDQWAGKIKILGDIVNTNHAEFWEAAENSSTGGK